MKGSNKDRSRQHEDFIADLYEGKRSPSSGAADTDSGDVRVKDDQTLWECKLSGNTASPRRSTIVKQMEKIAYEAYEEGKEPGLALRFFDPDSTLAWDDGYVDVVVRLARDDAYRSERLDNGAAT
jgi:hypothetical protein